MEGGGGPGGHLLGGSCSLTSCSGRSLRGLEEAARPQKALTCRMELGGGLPPCPPHYIPPWRGHPGWMLHLEAGLSLLTPPLKYKPQEGKLRQAGGNVTAGPWHSWGP